jgi:hypothetical protein
MFRRMNSPERTVSPQPVPMSSPSAQDPRAQIESVTQSILNELDEDSAAKETASETTVATASEANPSLTTKTASGTDPEVSSPPRWPREYKIIVLGGTGVGMRSLEDQVSPIFIALG